MILLLATFASLMLSTVLLLAGHGLSSTIIPLRAGLAGFGDLQIGLISSSFYVGFVIGCFFGPYLILRAGHIRAFAALVSLMSGAALLHPIMIDPIAWALFRAITGVCFAGINLTVESWLNDRATNDNRGTVMSLYIICYLAATMSGQLMVVGFEITTFVPFAIASIFVSVAVVPVVLTHAAQPAPITLVRFRPVRLYQTSAVALIGCLLIGLANSSLWALAPLYATQVGYSINEAAYFAAAIVLGGAVTQWPIGRLSDRVDRRFIILLLGICAALAAILMFLLETGNFWTTFSIFIVLGMASQPTYAIVAAHAFDYVEPEDYVETSSGVLMSNGIGSMIGPTLAAGLMFSIGPNGLFAWVAIVEVALALFVVSRLFIRPADEDLEKTDFEYGATSNMGAVLTPDPLDMEDPYVIPPEEFPAYEPVEGMASEEVGDLPNRNDEEESPLIISEKQDKTE
ncbi:MFS transporter [Pseudovibrio sp. Tun.PSC04-5.I4]|uniref:MFS transporter n=1 Tax=Pseudovibrio sp. Tun.PSC04-5.I4 TaxID=1798213 RepID=UPI0008882009|nr:MFS transporter [Pseudovibrio sp. Tun.PSC04-5.I4]SDQ82234.1 Predicted arabinose efflux permease, MFS family [Pseudovibrio sp. Tun.PSC04-5.I4]